MAKRGMEIADSFCLMCTKVIPLDRLKKNGITCSKECAKARRDQLMALMDSGECKYCRKPSTPEQRAKFKQFQAWLRDQAKKAKEVA